MQNTNKIKYENNKTYHVAFFAFCLSGMAGQKGRTLKNPFFVFNNGLNKQGLSSIPYDEQAAMLKSTALTASSIARLRILELKNASQGLKIYADYVKIDIDQKEPYIRSGK